MRRGILVPLLFLLLTAISGCTPESMAQWNEYLNAGMYTPVAIPSQTPESTPVPTAPPPQFDMRRTENYLLMGTDVPPSGGAWRTDSIIVIGVDRAYRRAAILSIPRDLWIDVPGIGQSRINQVDYYGERVLGTPGGGPALMSQVLSDTMGLEIQHWFRIDMNGFREAVDLIGGVTVDLACPYFELIYNLDTAQFEWFTLPAGRVTMDGETAYWFVRLRYYSSDFGRSGRQRQFLWALRQQVSQSNLLPQLPALWQIMNQNFSTDLTLFQVAELAGLALTLPADNVRAAAIPQELLERYFTPNGADVLRVRDADGLRALVDNIWQSPSLAGGEAEGACPPLPGNMPANLRATLGPPTPADRAPVDPGQAVQLGYSSGRGIRMRGEPTLSAQIVGVFQEGEQLTVLEAPNGESTYPVEQDGHRWYRVRSADGTEGWMSDIFFRMTES